MAASASSSSTSTTTTPTLAASTSSSSSSSSTGVPKPGTFSPLSSDTVAALADESIQVKRVCILGAGSFGTAASMLLARKGIQAILLARDTKLVHDINSHHHNSRYMKDIQLLPNISATTDINEAMKGVDLIIHAIPVQASLSFLRTARHSFPDGVPIISLSKGIHAETLQFMCDIFKDTLGNKHPTAYLSGPSFAKELMEGQPTGLLIASEDIHLAHRLQFVFASSHCRCYASTDVMGVELGGALKNVYAVAAGVAAGMGFGMNCWALLVTRGLSEMRRLAHKMGANKETLSGLSGVGDLVLTCAGQSSRNRRVGVALGQGRKLADILAELGEVAEGVPTAGAAVKLAVKYDIKLPLAEAVAKVISAEVHCKEAFITLMEEPIAIED